jgi:hypothetical protein
MHFHLPAPPSKSFFASFCALQTTEYAGAIGGFVGAPGRATNLSTEKAPELLYPTLQFNG